MCSILKEDTAAPESLPCLAAEDAELSASVTWQALANREEAVCDGRLQTVIYIRDTNAGQQEISGYIDFHHRCPTSFKSVLVKMHLLWQQGIKQELGHGM